MHIVSHALKDTGDQYGRGSNGSLVGRGLQEKLFWASIEVLGKS